MDKIRLRLDLDLKTISALLIAQRLWDLPDIKTEIKNRFRWKTPMWLFPEYERDCYYVTQKVVDHLDSFTLPPKIFHQLRKTIILIGEKIFDWIYYVRDELKMKLFFTETIYWTNYGTIDEVKIFRLSWTQLWKGPDHNRYYPKPGNIEMFYLACKYVDLDFIRDHRQEMIQKWCSLSPYIEFSEGEDQINNILIALWASQRLNEMSYRQILKFFQQQHEVFCIFVSSIRDGASHVIKYFWDEMPDCTGIVKHATEHSPGILMQLIWRIFEIFPHNSNKFIQEKICEIFVFLVGKMDESEGFFPRYKFKIMELFLPIWPYQELIPALFDTDIELSDSSELSEALYFILKCKRKDDLTKRPIEKDIYFRVFHKIWTKLPDLVKHSLFTGNNSLLTELIWKKEFEMADQFLDWTTDSSEERHIVKKLIDGDRLCRQWADSKEFKTVRKFLKWQSDSDDEVLKNKASKKLTAFWSKITKNKKEDES